VDKNAIKIKQLEENIKSLKDENQKLKAELALTPKINWQPFFDKMARMTRKNQVEIGHMFVRNFMHGMFDIPKQLALGIARDAYKWPWHNRTDLENKEFIQELLRKIIKNKGVKDV